MLETGSGDLRAPDARSADMGERAPGALIRPVRTSDKEVSLPELLRLDIGDQVIDLLARELDTWHRRMRSR